MSNVEQTLSIIKPDAVERNLESEIKEMFKINGFTIFKEKKIQIEKVEAEKFYKVHETKPFYNDLCSYLSSGPIVVMVLEGSDAIATNRKIMGATDPKNAEKNTIELLVGKEELIERKNKWTQPQYKFKSGTLLKYIRNVSNASMGCVTDDYEEW